MIHKTAERNREIFAAYQKGNSLDDLAKQYERSPATVQQIILSEKHKQAVSVEPFYQDTRIAPQSLQPEVKP